MQTLELISKKLWIFNPLILEAPKRNSDRKMNEYICYKKKTIKNKLYFLS